MSYQAVLFDLDGTLLDTLADLADSMNTVLRGAGLPEHPAEAYKYFVGDGMDILVRRALPENRRDEATIAGCLSRMREEYGGRWADQTRPYAGVPELLDALAARGIRLAILSNKPDDFTQLTVEPAPPALGLCGGGRRQPRRAEETGPSPSPLGRRETRAPAGGLFSISAIPARTCGPPAGRECTRSGALWGFRTAEELLANGAKTLIEKPGELLGLI